MARLQDITVEILRVLSQSDEPLDEAVLHAALNARLVPSPGYPDLADALRVLENNRYISKINNLRGPRWFVTDKGRAELHA
jgi:repressor of nif and glnA expression